uniref:Zn(2)-C6 fungal-type domain-containing protein n=1 Tax=Bionectria ochroleuca TaxID=29856 RepID=A0A8H7NES3_BIOOC
MESVRSRPEPFLPPVLSPVLPPTTLPTILPPYRPTIALPNHSVYRSSDLQPNLSSNLQSNYPSSELPPIPSSNPEPKHPAHHSSNPQPDLSSNLQPNYSPTLPCLAPKPASSNLPPPSREPVSKRRSSLAACDRCRKRKIKCNAQRPACGCCVASGKDCNYYTKPSESRAHALKRKHNELQQKVESDATVLEMLRSSRPEDAQELVERIRQRQDSHSIVQDVQNGALLLQLSGAAPAEIPGSYTAASPSYSTDASESSYYTY